MSTPPPPQPPNQPPQGFGAPSPSYGYPPQQPAPGPAHPPTQAVPAQPASAPVAEQGVHLVGGALDEVPVVA
ncbi:hypothetical protein ACSNOH_34535, partial [Streptomyces sp. URMC 127]